MTIETDYTKQPLAAYLQGAGIGLAGGYFVGWWLGGELLYGVAVLAIVSVSLGYVVE